MELSGIPQQEECLLRGKLNFHQELATIGSRICFHESFTCHLTRYFSCVHACAHTHTRKQTETRNDTVQIRNRETDLDNLLQNSV